MKDRIVFTKDAVYLQGLLEVHTLYRLAIRDNKPKLLSKLFAGRLTIADAARLDPLFESGWLLPPVYVRKWAAELRRLAASMAFSAFIGSIDLDKVTLGRVIELEEELSAS